MFRQRRQCSGLLGTFVLFRLRLGKYGLNVTSLGEFETIIVHVSDDVSISVEQVAIGCHMRQQQACS